MKIASWRHWAGGLIALLMCIGLTAGLRSDEPATPRSPNLATVADDTTQVGTDEAPSPYWLGVACEPVSDAARAQLDIPKDQGLLVRQVMPDSPAAKAGLKPNDILLQAGDKPLASTADLLAAVAAAKTKELSLKLLRDGKSLTLAVTPAERPKSLPGEAVPQLPNGPERALIEAWLKQFGVTPGHAGRVQIVRPGTAVLMGPGGRTSPRVELPDNLSVDIHREGKKPAQITVKRGSDKWEVNEDELSKLPDDVRRFVEPLVGRGPMRIDIHSLPLLANPMPGMLGMAPANSAAQSDLSDAVAGLQRQVESQRRAMEDLSRQMLDLNRAMQQLNQQRSQPSAPPSK